MNFLNGKTTDFQSLNRVGYFDIAKDNRFRFSYDTLDVAISGDSKFKATNFNIGAVMKLERMSLGFNIFTPYTLTRDWNSATITTNPAGATTTNNSAEDKFEIPASFLFGASITPIDQFTISLDYQFANYSNGKFNLGQADSTQRDWIDQSDLRCGLEYRPFAFLSLLAGYRYTTETFVPDGAAIKDRGPAATSYTLGASIKLFQLGRLDIAYAMQRLKYYDSYFSNTNYVFESLNNFLVGYTLEF